MTIAAGTTIGAYRVTGPLGKGGMGEVWRAVDTNLDREVALKVLPDDVAGNQERMSRFEREAKVLASLNHPNIAHLYNLERVNFGMAAGTAAPQASQAAPESVVAHASRVQAEVAESSSNSEASLGPQAPGPVTFLVMELVEGEDLSERIDRGPVAIDEAVAFALQIAEALEAAHARGIIHRDLKPANIKIRSDGAVKVLDFGLAKAWAAEDDSEKLSMSPTLTRHATIEGVILGTAAYMSPEQARGQAVDKRADIWSFGVVLWQMLTGRTLFEGDTVSDTLASVLKEEPDFDTLPEATPTPIRRLLRRCLQKDPRNRLHDIADARLELTEKVEDQPGPADGPEPVARSPVAKALPWVAAALAAAAALWMWLGPRGSEQEARRLVAQVPPPAGTEFFVSKGFAISPDGSKVVFASATDEGTGQLWLHSLDDGSARPLDGTDGGKQPFWAPDGSAIGFFADDKLKTLRFDQNVIEILADASGRVSGAWNPRGVIVATEYSRMFKIPAGGGKEESLTGGESDSIELLFPSFLPDDNHFLYLARDYASASEMHELRIGSLGGGPPKVIMASYSNAVYAPWGELLWWQDGHIRAQPFDSDRLELTGEPRLFLPEVQFDPRIGFGMFSVANYGTVIYRSGGIVAGDELGLVDRDGRDLGAIGEPGNFYHPRLSPDGSMVAVDRSDVSNRGDIWIYDIERGSGTRFTSEPEDESVPVWSPDGRRLAFVSNRVMSRGAVHFRSLRGANDERVLYGEESIFAAPWSWTSAGLVVEYNDDGSGGGRDIGVYSLEDEAFTPHVTGQFSEVHGAISPDGRLLAYQSDETGRFEVYVEAYPDPVDRWRVSNDGGAGPMWRRDGRELYFVRADRELMAAPVREPAGASAVEIGTPKLLFTAAFKPSNYRQPFDTLDGQTFVINRSVGDRSTAPLTIVVNAAGR